VAPTPEELEAGQAQIPVTGLGYLREVVAQASGMARGRGSSRELISFLQVATGMSGFSIDERATDENDQPMPFHVVIRGPAEAGAVQPLIDRIVQAEKPAYVTYELRFGAAA
jgi:hypothetical protein